VPAGGGRQSGGEESARENFADRAETGETGGVGGYSDKKRKILNIGFEPDMMGPARRACGMQNTWSYETTFRNEGRNRSPDEGAGLGQARKASVKRRAPGLRILAG
jgi:hypothetical protein